MVKTLLLLLLPLFSLIPSYDLKKNADGINVACREWDNADPQQKSLAKPFEDLPVVAFPVDTSKCDFLVLVVSGDGGWNAWEESLRKEFIKKGIPLIGLDALKYFWKEKTPEQVTSDLSKVLDYYLRIWKKQNFILLGYSFGANIVPFIATRLKEPDKSKLVKIVLISPDPQGDFEIHFLDMLNMDTGGYKYNVADEVKKIKNTKIICMFGASEDTDRKKMFRFDPVQMIDFPGKHHFRFNFPPIIAKILEK
jgi:type IV secretory pathway VirJ component